MCAPVNVLKITQVVLHSQILPDLAASALFKTSSCYSSKPFSVLQCVAVCCSVLQCVAVCCSVLQCVAVCCSPCVCCLPPLNNSLAASAAFFVNIAGRRVTIRGGGRGREQARLKGRRERVRARATERVLEVAGKKERKWVRVHQSERKKQRRTDRKRENLLV